MMHIIMEMAAIAISSAFHYLYVTTVIQTVADIHPLQQQSGPLDDGTGWMWSRVP